MVRDKAEKLVRMALARVPAYGSGRDLRLGDAEALDILTYATMLEEVASNTPEMRRAVDAVRKATPQDLFSFDGVGSYDWNSFHRFRGDVDVTPSISYLEKALG